MPKTALLVVDMQKGLREEASSFRAYDMVLMYINAVSKLFRETKNPVIMIQDLSVGHLESEAFQLVDELKVSDMDYRIHKEFNNAFWETELMDILEDEEVDSAVICGFAAEHCVLFTYNGAVERGLHAFLLQKGIAGETAEGVQQAQLIRPVISYEALEYYLRKSY